MPRKRTPKCKDGRTQINSYKLFHFRHKSGMEPEVLATRTGISSKRVRQLEAGVNCPNTGPTQLSHFPFITTRQLNRLESALNCRGMLAAGTDDDFASDYLHYWSRYISTPLSPDSPTAVATDWKPKAVIFDFDGTLTAPETPRNTWEAIWHVLGYNENECGLLAKKYFDKQITHSEWCQQTLEKFRTRNLSLAVVRSVAKNFRLIRGFDACMNEIKQLAIPAYIVSGSIWDVISTVLGDRARYFKRIEANTFGYTPDGILGTITGTKFDFGGKGDFVKEVAKELQVQPSDILFVGNSINDTYVKASGARTLLVNPRLTNPSDRSAWDFYIPRMTSLFEIMPFVDPLWNQRQMARLDKEWEPLKDVNELRLTSISVLGKYRRFSQDARSFLAGLADRIRRPLLERSYTRENFLIYAPPGSGKTFFIEELARTLIDKIKFVPIDLSADDCNACKTKLAEVVGSELPCLCMIDEVDSRKDEDWPYDTIFKKLDLNEQRNRPAVVFVLIGSSGGTVGELGEVIRARIKGKDMVDRILQSPQHCANIPPMEVADKVCVYASKILEAAADQEKGIQEIEKFAAYHAVTYATPRQIKLLADQAVRRTPVGHTQVLYACHFETHDDATKEAFAKQHSNIKSYFGIQTFRICE